VDDALVVRLLEGFGDLLRDLEGLVDRDRPAGEALLEVLALDELEGEEGLAVRFLETVDRGDVRVIQRREEVGLALEAGEALGVLRDLGGEDLDGHVAAERRVGRPVDFSHAASPDGGRDPVVGQRLADQHTSRLAAGSGLPPQGRACAMRKARLYVSVSVLVSLVG
jgi:hypothetical protein